VEIVSSYYRSARLSRSVRDKKKEKKKRGRRVERGGVEAGVEVGASLRRLSPFEKSRETAEIFCFRARYSPRESKTAAGNDRCRCLNAPRFRVVPQAEPRTGTKRSTSTSRMPAESYRPLTMRPCATDSFSL